MMACRSALPGLTCIRPHGPSPTPTMIMDSGSLLQAHVGRGGVGRAARVGARGIGWQAPPTHAQTLGPPTCNARHRKGRCRCPGLPFAPQGPPGFHNGLDRGLGRSHLHTNGTRGGGDLVSSMPLEAEAEGRETRFSATWGGGGVAGGMAGAAKHGEARSGRPTAAEARG